MPKPAIELGHRKIGICLAQDVIGLPSRVVIPSQDLQLLGHLCRNAARFLLSISAFLSRYAASVAGSRS
jgi:hypothetical protein